MSSKKPDLYFHQPTGNLAQATPAQAKKFNKDWHKILFVKNEEGKPVMRFTFIDDQGNRATVDVQQGDDQEVEIDGNTKSE
jgi:hypothetical protein